jgi:amidase/nitrilase
MPLARVALINQGEEFHVCVWPGNWKRGSEKLLDADTSEGGAMCNLQNLIKVHAFEAGAFVLSACGYLDEQDFPGRWGYIRDSDHMNFSWASGGSSIVSPGARYLVEPNFEKDAILYTECYANQIKATKAIFDSLGHYSRWDIFQLQINRINSLNPEVSNNSLTVAAELPPEEIKRISEEYEIDIEKVERLIDDIKSL